MKILNVTRKTILSEDAKEAKSFLDRTLGLLRSSNPRTLIFKTRFGIHTFGLRVPIDLVVLDKKGQVKVVKKSLKPGKLFFWNPQFETIIELPRATLRRTKTQKGDLIEFRLLFSSK